MWDQAGEGQSHCRRVMLSLPPTLATTVVCSCFCAEPLHGSTDDSRGSITSKEAPRMVGTGCSQS